MKSSCLLCRGIFPIYAFCNICCYAFWFLQILCQEGYILHRKTEMLKYFYTLLFIFILFSPRNFKFNDVNNEGARRIARLARESGVERLIHFSALNASPTPQEIYIKGGSQFLKTKVNNYYKI